MASAIAELRAIASLDTKPFEAGARKLEGIAAKAQKGISIGPTTAGGGPAGGPGGVGGGLNAGGIAAIATAFVAAAAAVSGFVLSYAKAASEMKRNADAIGISSGMLNTLGDMHERTGGKAENLAASIVKLADSQENALRGNKGAIESFSRLGISMSELQRLTPDQLLLRVAQGSRTSATAISDLNEVMGRGAALQFAATLKDLAENGLPPVNEEVTAQIEGLAQLDNKWTSLKQTLSDYGRTLVVVIAQTLGLIAANEELAAQAAKAQAERDEAQRRRLRDLQRERYEKGEKQYNKEVERANAAVAEVDRRTAESMSNITVATPQAADRLARIGGVIGGQTDPNRGLLQRQLKEMELQRKATEDIQKIAVEFNKKIEEIAENTAE